jgi:cytochrome c556
MKSRVVVIGLVCVAGMFFILINAALNTTSPHVAMTAEILPATLDQFYPPMSPAPAYLLAMLNLGKHLSTTMCDVQENDLENARGNFEAFKKEYVRISTMIPEWKEKYPMAPLEQLETVITTGDPSKIMPAGEPVAAVCHSCHLTFMSRVQQKYRWGNFGNITLTDPLSKQDVSFARLMLMMETNFEGITNDLAQGQNANALPQLAGFQARFEEMNAACVACHDSGQLYYTGADITKKISDLQAELTKPKADLNVVRELVLTIGQESCSKCHLVHIPAAYSQQVGELR